MPTVDEVLGSAEKAIKASKKVDLWRPSDARVNAEELLGAVLGKQITSDDLDQLLGASKVAKFDCLVQRRVAGEPAAIILGFTEFRKMKLIVKPGVFVPRSSSELLAEKAVLRLRRRKAPVAVDVATGTGPVALAMANEAPRAKVWGLDIWKPSLDLARLNARRLALNVQFVESNMLSKLPEKLQGKVDVFTCHPPYVAKSDMKRLPAEIKDFEPAVSLSDNSEDGLGLVHQLAEEATAWLRSGGWLLFEVSPDLARKVATILRHSGFAAVKSERDSLGATRVIAGKKP